ncbi:DUF998 domain-containing protein [Couchioplanes caeruleus]|uniref:DUF998 domain-containing protein n=1 Tax=Couchioplanes caeruleus TaxID=56438 RepID=UPI0008FF1393
MSLALYAMLHLVPPSADLDWSRRTISHYALLPNGWAFDAATLLLAAGSLAVLVALRGAGLIGLRDAGPVRRGAAPALLAWVAGLVGVVWFEKHAQPSPEPGSVILRPGCAAPRSAPRAGWSLRAPCGPSVRGGAASG